MFADHHDDSDPPPLTADTGKDVVSGKDKWDEQVQDFRARQQLKRSGAERLLAAGFSNEYVDQWKANVVKDEANIKWNKTNDGPREWDRGKDKDGLWNG